MKRRISSQFCVITTAPWLSVAAPSSPTGTGLPSRARSASRATPSPVLAAPPRLGPPRRPPRLPGGNRPAVAREVGEPRDPLAGRRVGEDERLEQRVRGQAVRAVEPRAGDL